MDFNNLAGSLKEQLMELSKQYFENKAYEEGMKDSYYQMIVMQNKMQIMGKEVLTDAEIDRMGNELLEKSKKFHDPKDQDMYMLGTTFPIQYDTNLNNRINDLEATLNGYRQIFLELKEAGLVDIVKCKSEEEFNAMVESFSKEKH